MKIAYIYDAVYPWVKGGAEKRIYEIAKRLANRGHEVHWYGVGWWLKENRETEIEHDGIKLHGVCEPMQLYVNGKRSIKEALVFAAELLPKLIKEDFEIIDCQEFPYFPCFTAKLYSTCKKRQLVITWHEIWDKYWFQYLGKKGIFGWMVERIVSKLTERNIAVSEKTKKELERMGVKNVRVIPNGIDFKKIDSIKPSEEESDIIFVGRLIKDKNVDILIKAISIVKTEMPDVRCLIVGDGPEREKLTMLVKKLELEKNIKFTGFLENYENVIGLMKSSKVFVLPSTREGFGIVALEANACGLPVITIKHERNASCEFVRDHENGFLCDLSERDVAEKILLGLKKGKTIRKRCVDIARKYDLEPIVDMIESFYESNS
uniref:Glycosyltransferase family 1 protein n=1 Tax=Geoglobus ahangari TaxID=113653 RepID=A0A7C3YMN8_9EURY